MIFHKHKYIITAQHKFDNELIKFIGTGATIDGFVARDLAKRGVITTAQCTICGKLKHLKTVFE